MYLPSMLRIARLQSPGLRVASPITLFFPTLAVPVSTAPSSDVSFLIFSSLTCSSSSLVAQRSMSSSRTLRSLGRAMRSMSLASKRDSRRRRVSCRMFSSSPSYLRFLLCTLRRSFSIPTIKHPLPTIFSHILAQQTLPTLLTSTIVSFTIHTPGYIFHPPRLPKPKTKRPDNPTQPCSYPFKLAASFLAESTRGIFFCWLDICKLI